MKLLALLLHAAPYFIFLISLVCTALGANHFREASDRYLKNRISLPFIFTALAFWLGFIITLMSGVFLVGRDIFGYKLDIKECFGFCENVGVPPAPQLARPASPSIAPVPVPSPPPISTPGRPPAVAPDPTPQPATRPQIPSDVPTSSDSNRFVRQACGAIRDRSTQLEWYIGPDKNMPLAESIEWVGRLRECGGGWAMPTIRDLLTLYDQSGNSTAGNGFSLRGAIYKARIDPIFNNIGNGAWAWPRPRSPGGTVALNLFTGRETTECPADGTFCAVRAFAVRAAH
jgi:hypothetical protein